MALTRQKSKPFTFQSTPRTADSQYFRREMERVLEYIDQQFSLLSSSDAVDSGIIPTSRGGLGANFSQIPTFGVPYATQAGKFGWKVSNSFSIGLLGNSTAASWRDALGVSSFDNISSGTVLGRYSSGSGQPEAATLGAGLLFSGSSLVVSQPLQDFANIIPADGDMLRFFGSSWTNQNLGDFWTDLVAEPELANYDYVELPFTFADDKRLLGRDGAAATEISIGSALVLSGGVLNTGPQLAAIEALTTTSYGIGLLEMVDDADLRSYAGLGTSAVLDAGVALGTATLDAGGKVPLSQIPDSVLGQVEYQGSWNASTNTPTLSTTPGAASKGFYYVTSVAGTFDGVDYDVGDWIISNGVIWEKVDNTDAVVSVAGRIGAITLFQADISGLTTADTPVFTSARFSGLTTDGILRTTSGNGTLAVSSFLSTALGGTGFTTYSEGDLLYGTAGGSLAKLASPFLPGYVLAASAGVPSWEQLSTLSATTITGTSAEIEVNGTVGSGQTGPITLTLPTALTFTGKTVTGGTFNSGAFNGTLGATTPSTVDCTTITTSAPSGGSAQPWKFGSVVGEEVQIEVNGVPRFAMLNNSGWLLFSVKNVTVNTAGSPSDVATITLPSWITRWTCGSSGPSSYSVLLAYAETASGTLAGASFVLRDGASGGGTAFTLSATGPTSAGLITGAGQSAGANVSTSTTLYIHQTADSANAGTISFYVSIIPII